MRTATHAILAVGLLLCAGSAHAKIQGLEGTTFQLTARDGYISTPDGNSIYMWGYAAEGSQMQYPGPTLIVQQGAAVTITLTNQLSVPTSIVFPGQQGVTASGGTPGLLTTEAGPGGTVTYSFVATEPGTYLYQSGSRPELQTELGLFGTLIVRPTTAGQAYAAPETRYDREALLVLSEIDPRIHAQVQSGTPLDAVDLTDYRAVYWFLNGRCAPDTMADDFVPWLPSQPYSAMVMMHPGDRLLVRLVGGGRNLHPLHTHGNHVGVFARDGRRLTSASGATVVQQNFSVSMLPGQTVDGIYTWTGERLGWDIYGHAASAPLEPNEYAPDHGKPIPVSLPNQRDLTFGETYSGSPYLGALGPLPPGQPETNASGGYYFMWHSHSEREMTTNDVFPGGMMTMLIVEPPSVPLP